MTKDSLWALLKARPASLVAQMVKNLPAVGETEGKMVGWHHRLNGHEFERTLGGKKDREAWGAVVHGVAKNWT